MKRRSSLKVVFGGRLVVRPVMVKPCQYLPLSITGGNLTFAFRQRSVAAGLAVCPLSLLLAP